MERRLGLVATIVLGGLVTAVALAIATGACHEHLYARWLARSGSGPQVPLALACAPSYLANAYALEFVYISAAFALVAGVVALGTLIVGRLADRAGTEPARRIVGWMGLVVSSLGSFTGSRPPPAPGALPT
jgi:hypothetical protein